MAKNVRNNTLKKNNFSIFKQVASLTSTVMSKIDEPLKSQGKKCSE